MASYLITGCSRGLGRALAAQLAARPASEVACILATARRIPTPDLQELADASQGRLTTIPLDVTQPSSIAQALNQVNDRLQGRGLDVLINNAGVGSYTRGGVENMDGDELTAVLNSNVTGTQRVTQAFLPLLRRGQRKVIANISTVMGSIGLAETFKAMPTPAYRISKTALNMLTVQYAHELQSQGFCCVAVSPGWLQTDLGGARADLPVTTGADAVLQVIQEAQPEQNGRFLNIHVPGWEHNPGLNQYDGREVPW